MRRNRLLVRTFSRPLLNIKYYLTWKIGCTQFVKSGRKEQGRKDRNAPTGGACFLKLIKYQFAIYIGEIVIVISNAFREYRTAVVNK